MKGFKLERRKVLNSAPNEVGDREEGKSVEVRPGETGRPRELEDDRMTASGCDDDGGSHRRGGRPTQERDEKAKRERQNKQYTRPRSFAIKGGDGDHRRTGRRLRTLWTPADESRARNRGENSRTLAQQW